MTPDQILLKAADIIAQAGHCKGEYYQAADPGMSAESWAQAEDVAAQSAPVCAIGALRRARFGTAGGSHYVTNPASELGQAIARLVTVIGDPPLPDATPEGRIIGFNDAPTTTAEDVILALKKAATAADIGEETHEVEFEPVPERAPAEPTPKPEPIPA
jgi:hypothetical protein